MSTKRELEERIQSQEKQIHELYATIDTLKAAKDDDFRESREYKRLLEENQALRLSEGVYKTRIIQLESKLEKIQKHLHDSGGFERTKRGRPSIDEKTKLRVRALRQDEYSIGDIAQIVGISKGVVHKILQHP